MNLSKKMILSTAKDFFARGDMLLLILCMSLGLCTAAVAQSTNTADFDALVPVMDLVCSASQYSPNAPETDR